MITISAIKLRRLLNMVPDNTPVYIVGNNNENKLVNKVSIESTEHKNFTQFEVHINSEN